MFLAFIIGNSVAMLYYVKCQVLNIYKVLSLSGVFAPLSSNHMNRKELTKEFMVISN